MRAIIAAREHGISLTATVFNVSRVSIATWISKFKDNPSNILNIAAGRGRKSKLTEDQLLIVKSWIDANHNLTLQQLSLNVQDKLNISLSIPAMHKIIKKLSLSYITPKPKHYKQDSSKHEEFKKNLAQEVENNRNVKFIFLMNLDLEPILKLVMVGLIRKSAHK